MWSSQQLLGLSGLGQSVAALCTLLLPYYQFFWDLRGA